MVFQRPVTLTLTSDDLEMYIIGIVSPTSTNIPNIIKIGEKKMSPPIIDHGAEFKVTWYKNGTRFEKSGPNDFRYCLIVSNYKVKMDVAI